MWKIIHLNSGHTLVTEDNIDLTKPVITANVLDHETSIALHVISGELLENVFYPLTYRPPIRRTEYRVANRRTDTGVPFRHQPREHPLGFRRLRRGLRSDRRRG